MNSKEEANKLISKIIIGLRTVLRTKAESLTLLLNMSNGFLNLNYPISEEVTEFDTKKGTAHSKETQEKFFSKFKSAKEVLEEITQTLEIELNEKIPRPVPKIESFQNLTHQTDKYLEYYQITTNKLIEKIPKHDKKLKEIINRLKSLIN